MSSHLNTYIPLVPSSPFGYLIIIQEQTEKPKNYRHQNCSLAGNALRIRKEKKRKEKKNIVISVASYTFSD